MITLGINGCNRTARSFIRLLCDQPELSQLLTIGLINIGPGDMSYVPHLFKYDALLGTYPLPVNLDGDFLCIGKRKIRICTEPDPKKIDWTGHGISWVIETTGMCVTKQDVTMFPGVRLLLAYPAPGCADTVVIRGLQQNNDDQVVSIGASYDQALGLLVDHINATWGVVAGSVTVFDAYTDDYLPQVGIEDLVNENFTLNAVQRSAARTLLPCGEKNMHMIGYDTVSVTRFSLPLERASLVDCAFLVQKNVDSKQVIQALNAIVRKELSGVVEWSTAAIGSCDVIDNPHVLLIDESLIRVQGNLIKICGWYDAVTSCAVTLREVLKNTAVASTKCVAAEQQNNI